MCAVRLVTQPCLTLCEAMDCSPPCSFVHGDSPSEKTRVGCHALLQGNNIYFSQYGGWKVPAGLVSGEGSLPGLQMGLFTVSAHGGKQRKEGTTFMSLF